MPLPVRPTESLLPGSNLRRKTAAGGGERGNAREGDVASVSFPPAEAAAPTTSATASGSSGGGRDEVGGIAGTPMISSEEGNAERTSGHDEGSGSDGQKQQQRRKTENILDLCCGSGVQGIAAVVLRRGQASVTCVDINPRAIRFSRFNALLNGLDIGTEENDVGGRNFRAVVGDLYGALNTATAVENSASETVAADGAPSFGGGRGAGSASSRRSVSGDTSSTKSSPAADDHYDLILANPPFVPVPPKLGAVRRRYDVFASGGPSGEEVIERIFRGALERLRPGGGLLAVVTELANPRTFDAKLRHWVGGVGVHDVGVETVKTTEKEMSDGIGGNSSSSSNGSSDDCVGRQEEDHPPGRGDGDFDTTARNTAPRTSASGSAATAWTGVVLHEREPWTAREYAARRAGSSQEAEGWERHLTQVGIEEMSAGFVFVRRHGGCGRGARRRRPSVTTSTTTTKKSSFSSKYNKLDGDECSSAAESAITREEDFCTSAESSDEISSAVKREESSSVEAREIVSFTATEEEFSSSRVANGTAPVIAAGEERKEKESHHGVRNGSGGGGVGYCGDGAAKVEIQGVEKLWAPHNRAALEISAAALRRT